jgi:hypothetical protein
MLGVRSAGTDVRVAMTRFLQRARAASAVVAVLFVTCAWSASAGAQVNLQEAKEAFIEGQEAYDRGHYDRAIALWQRSFELSQKISLHYNIGLAYERLGRLQDATASLERFVAGSQPDDPYLDRGRARLAAIKERLAQTGVVIRADQEGAVILIDGRDFGRTPRPDRIALAPGSHSIIVRKPGFSDFRSDVALADSQELQIDVRLTPQTLAPADAVVAAEQGAAPAPPEQSSSAVGPVLTIGGGAVAVAGLVVGAIALGKAKDARNEDDADSARTLALVADVTMLVGVAATAVGAYLWFFASDEPAPVAAAEGALIGVAPHRHGALVSAQVRF